jgi:winged helix-turn helix protein
MRPGRINDALPVSKFFRTECLAMVERAPAIYRCATRVGCYRRGCRRPIKMSPLCQLQTTLRGGVGGDGSANERSGADAAGSAAGFGSQTSDDTEEAAPLLGLERRQVFRLSNAYRTAGPAGLISKRRGHRSNRRKPEALRRAVLAIIRERYWDFGPTLATEKLREVHWITLGRETLRFE